LRTNVYIDGFNFYYRCVKGTPYKWLDFSILARLLLPGNATVNRIRYFTARITPLPGNPDAPARQQVYLRALGTIPNLDVTFGHFLTNETTMPLAVAPSGGPKVVRVLRTDEKGSDVNFATYLLLDAFKKDCQAALIISNDSDLVEPIRIVRDQFGLRIVLAVPPKNPSVTLLKQAHLIRRVRQGVLQASQFPDELTDSVGTFRKPATW
jgi:hypothetical protein